MMKLYLQPELQIVQFQQDVITASGEDYVNFNPDWLE